MSDSHRGRPYQPSQGQGSYGPPPPYQGPQWQPQPQADRWQQAPQQQWQEPSHEHHGGHYDDGDAAGLPLAPILRRAGARLIDNILVAVFGFALILPVTIGVMGLGKPGTKTEDEGGIWNWPIIFTLFCVLSVLPFIYEAVQLSMWGRTLGKRLLGLGVVQARPAGEALTTTQGVWRAGITHVGYQLGVFFFLVLAVMVWDYAAYGMLLVWAGALMAYLWAIWDQPLHQALHDRFAGTLVIDERVPHDEYAE
ncbi:RDD family protein [Spirillospora albida]|uniref:RDD family protein n=1 Tax=Spirillospora albida TaxID=58123 RepID=UPI0004C27382|nr:RDD family protein [Spirillospora albida]